MKILSSVDLPLSGVKVVRFARFKDHRGFFTEPFRRSDFDGHPDLGFLRGISWGQTNESYSHAGVVRGLHFQWNPFMGKLVRTVSGHMVDIVLDIRKESPTLGRAIMYDMPATTDADWSEWIWVPPGFAHGNFFPAASHIDYMCSGEYSPGCEACISPVASDIDWGLCDPVLKARFDALVHNGAVLSPKDRDGLTLDAWLSDGRSNEFGFGID
jgi:dTDP-4-dehydrorhamnose 3,5-epimerase